MFAFPVTRDVVPTLLWAILKKINPLCKKFFSKKTESFVDIHFITGLKKHTSKKRALLISRGDQNFGKPTIIQKIFDTNSIFHVK